MDPLKTPPPQESKLHFLDYWRIIRIRKTVILAVFLLVVITATLVTFILPPTYASTARVKVERDQPDITPITGQPLNAGYDPYFIQTEFEVMKSEVVLSKVIDSLDLNREWGKKYNGGQTLKPTETMLLLQKRMDLRPVRNTSLIEITVYSEKADEAAKIANAIAEAYRQYRLDERKEQALGGIKTLREQFDDQEQKVKEAQAEVDKLRQKLHISDADANANQPSPSIEYGNVQHLEALRIQSEAEYEQQKKLLDQLKSLSRDDLRRVLPTALQPADTLLISLLEQLNMAQQRLLALAKDYKPDHPVYQNAQSQVDDLDRKVGARVDGDTVGLEERVASMKAFVDSLKEQVASAKQIDIEKAAQSQPYYDAKQRLERLLRFQTILDMKIASETTDVNLPKTAMVTIVDRAQPGQFPVRPNKPLNIILGVVIGLIVGVGLAFFIEYLDTSVKTIDDVERTLQAPVLGVIPQNVGILLDEGADSPYAEAYRVLRTNLLFSRKDDRLNTLCVVSAGAGEGKSTTVLNLATVFAQSGQRVLVVDSDLRRPTLHKILQVSNNLGLTNYLLKQNTLEEVIQTTSCPTLDLMPSGKLPSSSLGILSSPQMREFITELKRRYDFILFDSPPIMGVSDASVLASEVDMTLQVIQYRRYPQPMNVRAKQMVEKVGGNLVGVVLNNINVSQDESYYYYSGYYHGYYYSQDEEEAAEKKEAPTSSASSTEKSGEIKQKY